MSVISKIVYDDKEGCFVAVDKFGDCRYFFEASDDGIEIIGNIYENSDLLK